MHPCLLPLLWRGIAYTDMNALTRAGSKSQFPHPPRHGLGPSGRTLRGSGERTARRSAALPDGACRASDASGALTNFTERRAAFLQELSKGTPFSLGGVRVIAVFGYCLPDAFDSLTGLGAGAESTVKATAPVAHRRALAWTSSSGLG